MHCAFTTNPLISNIEIISNEILYIEGSGNYLSVHTLDKKLMVLMSMNDAMKILPESDFARIHKSYIVALNQIKVIENHQVQINDVKIPIGKYYKESFFKKVKQ